MIVGVLTTCHTQYTPKFVTYLTGALYVHPLWFYKHQHDNRVRSKVFVACQRWWFQWRFWFVPSAPGFSFSLFRKVRQTFGCGMPRFLLPLTVDFLGLRTKACLTCSTCSSVTDGLPVLFLLHTHPVSWNCTYHLRMELSNGGCFPNLVRNCRWTIVTDRYSWNISTQNAFSMPFAAILVNCAPSGEMHNYCTPHIIKENSENFLMHQCNYVFLSQVYCVWQVVKTPTIVFNNPVFKLVHIITAIDIGIYS